MTAADREILENELMMANVNNSKKSHLNKWLCLKSIFGKKLT